jgi:hypothetical protein
LTNSTVRERDACPHWGLELDWFGIDRRGHVALFSTARVGPVPLAVMGHVDALDALSGQLKAKRPSEHLQLAPLSSAGARLKRRIVRVAGEGRVRAEAPRQSVQSRHQESPTSELHCRHTHRRRPPRTDPTWVMGVLAPTPGRGLIRISVAMRDVHREAAPAE